MLLDTLTALSQTYNLLLVSLQGQQLSGNLDRAYLRVPEHTTPIRKYLVKIIFCLDYIGDYNDDEFESDEEDYDETDPDYQQFEDSREMDQIIGPQIMTKQIRIINNLKIQEKWIRLDLKWMRSTTGLNFEKIIYR